MTTPDDFFSMPEPDVKRGDGGSPLLIPRGFERLGVESPYTRASYMADYVESKEHIHRWEMRYLAKAMGQNEDLAALAAAETYSTGISDATFGREKTASGRRLDAIIERALDRVRIHEKADRGSAVHAFTEPGAPDGDAIPERLKGPVAAFWETNRRNGIELVATEMFTANDKVMSAGTFDHLVRCHFDPVLTDYVIADKKTGNFAPLEWAIQLSIYANGDPYDTDTNTRPAWPGRINTSFGLVWQIDCHPKTKDENRVNLWVVDLEFGWEMAQVAAKVRDAQKRQGIAGEFITRNFSANLDYCNTTESLRALWESTDDPAEQARVEEKARSL